MRLKNCYVSRQVGDQYVMVDMSDDRNRFMGMIRSNEVAAFLVDLLREDTSEDRMVERLLDEYEVDRPEALDAVRYVVAQLSSIGAIEETIA